MSDNKAPRIKYDVFVSFMGKDIRQGFLSHLIDAFDRKKINAFVDDKLEKGDEIWPSLVEAIEESFISLIIFSQNYASSRWCLQELVTILECKDKYRRIVIPVFYRVAPTHVRHQSGSYENAFAEHGMKYKRTKVQIWKHALDRSANLSGIESSKFQNDAELVKEIVNIVLKKLAKPMVNSKRLVAIDERVADVESLISKEPKETRLIGIWGMGGIGKTTLAEEVFNKLQSKYEGCYFLADERVKSSRHGIISLKEIMFSKLLGDDVKIETPNSLPENFVRRISCMKVLIVLDDVNDFDHLEKLLGTLENFGPGSRIIITTRDLQVLKANKAHEEYQLREFSSDEALELFNWNVFNQSDHEMEYNKLLERVVYYAQGIPLVLKVLAGHLRGNKMEVWESELDKLQKMPLRKVYDVMIWSYDDLDRKQQHIFLDLACFFLQSHTRVNVGDLISLLKDGESDNSLVADLERLKDKALITLTKDNFVFIHDSLNEMAWEIVCRESVENRGSCSRLCLWDPNDDIYEALKNDKGTEAIRSIQIHLPTVKKQHLSSHIFAKMSRLQFLEISVGDDFVDHATSAFSHPKWQFWLKQREARNVDILAKGLQFLATELRFLCWKNYPLKSLPKNFSAEKLVILNLQCSRMQKLWHGVKKLVNLKVLDLSQCNKLEELPDLSEATNLEVLILWECSMLTSVHPSIFFLPKLETLDLSFCKSLTILTSNAYICSLSYLNLDFCENLTEFSLISENMKELRLQWTKVKALPSSFGHLSKLKLLHLNGSDIKRLPSSINNLTQLLHLDISNCSKLQTIKELTPFLETLNAQSCHLLQSLPVLPTSLKTLNVGGCSSLQNLPELPKSLETLNIAYCKKLQTVLELPRFLETLNAINCESLRTVLFPSTAVEQSRENSKLVLFWNCLNLDEQSLVAIGLNAQINVMKFANQHLPTPTHDHVENYNDYNDNLHSYQAAYVYPGSSVPEWLEYKTTKDYIIIDLSCASSPLGFIFCFVLGEFELSEIIDTLEFDITISDNEGEGKKDSVRMHIRGTSVWTNECDQVCVMYDQRCSDFLNSRAKDQTKFKIEVTMETRFFLKKTYYGMQQFLKGFGVSSISTSAYNSFI